MIDELIYGGARYTSFNEDSLLKKGVPESVINAAIKEQQKVEVNRKRKVVYSSESDPLYMEWKFDQTVESEKAWRDKVAEIKARYPLPE